VGVWGNRESRDAPRRHPERNHEGPWGCGRVGRRWGTGLGFDSSVIADGGIWEFGELGCSAGGLCSVYLCGFSWHVGFFGLFGYRGCKPEQPIIISGTGLNGFGLYGYGFGLYGFGVRVSGFMPRPTPTGCSWAPTRGAN
jgi:hypothetical protein